VRSEGGGGDGAKTVLLCALFLLLLVDALGGAEPNGRACPRDSQTDGV
jgi:hypothetical protein